MERACMPALLLACSMAIASMSILCYVMSARLRAPNSAAVRTPPGMQRARACTGSPDCGAQQSGLPEMLQDYVSEPGSAEPCGRPDATGIVQAS
eukprot:14711841-Alexandrium_andersonii.AAC.1